MARFAGGIKVTSDTHRVNKEKVASGSRISDSKFREELNISGTSDEIEHHNRQQTISMTKDVTSESTAHHQSSSEGNPSQLSYDQKLKKGREVARELREQQQAAERNMQPPNAPKAVSQPSEDLDTSFTQSDEADLWLRIQKQYEDEDKKQQT